MTMPVTRSFCPLDCGWYHDQADPDLSDPGAVHPFVEREWGEGIDSTVAGILAGHYAATEAILHEHFATHSLIQWFTALTNARGRAIRAERAVVAVDRAMRQLDVGPALAGIHDALTEWKGER